MYKVTIAIPIYNVEKYVERALLSALNQTFDSIEFLLIDDKGTDNSMSVVEKIITTHPRGKDIKIIEHSENKGLGAVRNTAIDHAQGEYIFFMDSDDELLSNSIETMYCAMVDHPVDFVQGANAQNSHDIYPYLKKNVIVDNKENFAIAKSIYCQKFIIYCFVCNKLYRLDFLKVNNIRCPKEVRNVEDRLFSFQVILHAHSCILLKNITYIYYKDNPDSFTTKEKNRGASIHIMHDYENIISIKYSKLYGYIDETFFTQAILENYSLALRFAKIINRSEIIPLDAKHKIVQKFNTLPHIKINKIPKVKNRLHLLFLICLSKFPSINIKIFMLRVYDKLLRMYNYARIPKNN